MDSQEIAERRKLIRLALWTPVVVGIVLVPTVWIFLYLKTGLKSQPARGGKAANDQSFWIPVLWAFSVLSVVVGVLYGLRQSRLVRRGTRVIGWLANHGGTGGSMMKVVCEYEFQGKTYTHEATQTPDLLNSVSVGDPLVVYLDPNKPRRSYVVWSSMNQSHA